MQKRLRRERWLKRLADLKASEKVKLKQLESLSKDSNHVDIQEDPLCKLESDALGEQLIHCRHWCDEQNSADMNCQRDILRLLELGKATLKFNIGDFMDLKNFH